MTLGGSTVDVPISTSTTVATRDELFSPNEQRALAGYLAGYSGLTRDADTLDLRQYVAWCTEHRVAVFGARRAEIECFARHLEALGAGPGHDRPPAVHRVVLLPIRRTGRPDRHVPGRARAPTPPGLRIPRHRAGPQRGRCHAGRRRTGQRPRSRPDQRAGPQRAAGLRSHRRRHRGPRTRARPPHPPSSARAARSSPSLSLPGQQGPSTSRSANAARGRSSPPAMASGSTVTPQVGSCAESPDERGSPSEWDPTHSATPSSPPPSTPAFHCATSKKPPATPIPAPPCATTAPGCPSTGTPPTSSLRSSPSPAADPNARSAQRDRSRAGIRCSRSDETRHASGGSHESTPRERRFRRSPCPTVAAGRRWSAV
jgi:hypothetical protein